MGQGEWLHGDISREEAEALMKADGDTKDGKFMVRERKGRPGEYIMCVTFRGRPTHHLITPDEAGVFMVNKKKYGGFTTLEETVEQLMTSVAGWPVVLRKGVAPRTPTPEPEPEPEPESDHEPVSEPSSGSESETEADPAPAAVTVQEPATSSESDGQESVSDSASVVEVAVTMPQSSRQQGKDDSDPASGAASAPSPTWEEEFEGGEAAASSGLDWRQRGALLDPNDPPPYYHENLSRQEGEDLVMSYKTSGDKAGTWLVRSRRSQSRGVTEYVIVIVYANRPTNHLIQQPKAAGELMINGKLTNGSRTLEELLKFLKAKPKFWPVDFSDYVPNEAARAAGDTGAAATVFASPQQDKKEREEEETVGCSTDEESEDDFEQPPVQTRDRSVTLRNEVVDDAGLNGAAEFRRVDLSEEELDALFLGPKIMAQLKRSRLSESWGFGFHPGLPLMIGKLAPGGLAEQSGIQGGDFVVRLNNLNSQHTTHKDLMDSYQASEYELGLVLARFNKRQTLVLKNEAAEVDNRFQQELHELNESTQTDPRRRTMSFKTSKLRRASSLRKKSAITVRQILEENEKRRLEAENEFPEDGYYTDE